jgi:hypothetical protein
MDEDPSEAMHRDRMNSTFAHFASPKDPPATQEAVSAVVSACGVSPTPEDAQHELGDDAAWNVLGKDLVHEIIESYYAADDPTAELDFNR